MEDEEEEWSGSYQPLAVEQAHLAAAGPSSPSAGSFFCEGAGLAGGEDPSVASLGAPPGPGFHSLRQPSYEEVSASAALPAPFSGRTQTPPAGSVFCQASSELVYQVVIETWCQPLALLKRAVSKGCAVRGSLLLRDAYGREVALKNSVA